MFKKNIVLNKYYRRLRNNVFADLQIDEFIDVFTKFKKLKFDYKLLKICQKLEKINIIRLEFPVFRFFSMFLDFIRWLIYDICWTIINGKVFKPYRTYCFLWSSRWGENYIYG